MYFLVEIEGEELLKNGLLDGCMITGLHIPNGQWSQQIRPVAVVEYLSSAIQVWEPKKNVDLKAEAVKEEAGTASNTKAHARMRKNPKLWLLRIMIFQVSTK